MERLLRRTNASHCRRFSTSRVKASDNPTGIDLGTGSLRAMQVLRIALARTGTSKACLRDRTRMSFRTVADEHELEVLVSRLGDVQKAIRYGLEHVGHEAASISRYGRITVWILSRRDNPSSSSRDVLWLRRPSRRASIATSVPTLLRRRKQSTIVLATP